MEKGAKINFYRAIFLLSVATLLALSFIFAAITVITPTTGVNYSSSGLFNVTFENATDIWIAGSFNQTNVNATFYYNLSGGWTFLGNSSTCANYSGTNGTACWGTIDTSSLNGVYSINATISNTTSTIGGSVITNNVRFDNLGPAVTMHLLAGINLSSQIDKVSIVNESGIVTLNISIIDATLDVVSNAYIVLINASGVHEANFTLQQEGSTNNYVNATSLNMSAYTEGIYNFTVITNDTLNNINNSVYSGAIYFDSTNPTITFDCVATTITLGATMDCTCSGADVLDGNPTEIYTSSPSTSTVGSFITQCIVTDHANNLIDSNLTYTVRAPSSGVSSSSTSSTATTWTKTYIISEESFAEGIAKELVKNERTRVRVNNKDHHIGILEVTTTTAKIEVASTPQEVTLAIGEDAKFDVTDNDYYDLLVTLNSITDGKVNVTIISINKEIPSDVLAAQAEETTTTEDTEEETSSRNLTIMWAVIIIVLILLIIGYIKKEDIIYFFNK